MNLGKALVRLAPLTLLAVSANAQMPFLTGYALNNPSLRNDFTGPAGMKLTVGPNVLTVSSVGRICVAGNSGSHLVKFVLASTGVDVSGGSATVSMSGCTPGQFAYQTLASSINLSANTTYFLVSSETSGGDQWYDFGTVAPTSDAAVNSSAYYYSGTYTSVDGANSSYVPPNFLYTVVAGTPTFITSFNSGATQRNDFSGWVGTQLTIGNTALTLTNLGRVCVTGNSQTHTVKLVLASNSTDVSGATASVNMAGCTPGQFVYATPAGSVTLLASTTYYLVSQETANLDKWYDQTSITTSIDASDASAVYSSTGTTYNVIGSANTSYVPPNFQYTKGGGPCTPTPISVTVGTNPPSTGLSFTVDSTMYTSTQTFSWTCGSTHSISTTSPQQVSGGSQQAFANWSDAGAISHMVTPTTPTTYTANFGTQYLLMTSVNPSGDGTIMASPSSNSGYYNSGQVVQLTGVPNSGFAFDHWSGDLSGGTNPQNITMSATHSVTANFTPSSTPPKAFITGFALNSPPLRNDYGDFVGMKFTVNSQALTVSSVGRICVAGNGQTHIVKFVMTNGTDVTGGSASVNMSGCTPGQFTYMTLSSPLNLPANTSYFLVSQEVSGGDQWYDQGNVSSTTDGTVNNSVYHYNGNYIVINSTNTSYVPPNFEYTAGTSASPVMITVQTSPNGLSFTVNGNTHTSPYMFSSTPGTPFTIATVSPQNTSGGSQQAFDNWSDGGAISHTVTTPSSPTAYTATFDLQYLLTTSVSPSGSGTINANPPSGSGYYNSGTVVTLTANASSGYMFSNWSGALTDSNNPDMLTMTGPESVTANFTHVTGPMTFLTSFSSTSPRNNFTGFVGEKITVGSNPLNIVSVGRACVAGNTASHTVKFVNAVTSADVPNGSATVSMSGCTAMSFVYSNVAIVLQPSTAYYLVSAETSGGDFWYDQGAVTSTMDGIVNGPVYQNGSSYITTASTNQAYVPTNFTYSVLPPNTTPAFVTAYGLNNPPLRNDFTGFVGMKITIGGTALSAASLGRVCVSGNSGMHTVEFVNASNSSVVGSVTVNMTNCTPGQFVYATPSSLIGLQAGGIYYLASQETMGGDQWYDQGGITTTNAATANSSVYYYNGNWITIGSSNTAYVPVNFTYAPQGTPIIEVFASQAPNVFGSPSWSGYATNAVTALGSGTSAIGNPSSDPTAYFQLTQENQRQNIVSPFISWLGNATPATPFSSELGNRLHFGLHIIGNGTKISLSELVFDMESTDIYNAFQFTGSFSDTGDPTNDYSSTQVGIIYGSPNTYITSGLPTQQVDEIILVGVGNSAAPSDVGCDTAGTNQQQLDCVATFYDSIMPFNVSTVYTLNNSSGAAVVSFIYSAAAGSTGIGVQSEPHPPSRPRGAAYK